MCLAVPMLIKTLAPGDLATVEIGGVERQVSLLMTPKAEVGQYILVHTGYALNVLDADETAVGTRTPSSASASGSCLPPT